MRTIRPELEAEYLEAVSTVEKNETRLSCLLSAEGKRLFLELMEAQRVINEFTAVENRLSGFQEGMQMGAELRMEERQMNRQNAWIYCRVNNLRDAIGVMNLQFQQLKKFAGQKGFSVVGVSQDYGSGQTLDRPGLRAIREAVCDGDIQVLLISSVSRIGRDAEQVGKFLGFLNEHGVQAYAVKEGELTMAPALEPLHGFTLSQT